MIFISKKCKDEIYEKAGADYVSGMTYQKLSEKYNVSISTIKTWRKKFNWSRNDMAISEKRTKMTTKGANLTKKKVTKKVSIAKKKTAVLAYKISTPEESKAIREDLLNQLKNNGAEGLFYTDLVDVYMNLHIAKNELFADLEKRGVVVEWKNGKQVSTKRNDSLDGVNKTVTLMVNLLTKLGLDVPENKNINPGKDEDDEAL
ncbi:helix-turn-helix domain-containing protein [Clostridium saudiense]|uniref:helix-turn-helix domain-containing protein n=1 Tax=Clostridium saudiense TaxID=1414720 RepID=UPI00267325CF|nr:RNA polymerase subunit sigma-70 [Clostridium saudiense]MDU7453117.1 RNA polymerase subunit sigma-70 [Clostridium saudiense]